MKRLMLLLIPLLSLSMFSCKKQGEESNISSPSEERQYISLSTYAITLPEDRAYQLEVTVDESLKDYLIFYTIRDPEIASVEEGLITAKKEGNTICTVQCGTYTANCAVNVVAYEPDASLSISLPKTDFLLAVNDDYRLPITVRFGAEAITEYALSASINHPEVVSFSGGVLHGLSSGIASVLLKATYSSYEAEQLISVRVL